MAELLIQIKSDGQSISLTRDEAQSLYEMLEKIFGRPQQVMLVQPAMMVAPGSLVEDEDEEE